ncbi:MAG: glycosyltransferase family 2 protein [Chloroflexi bacterium]|nr:glycosyltransferase family 2 protein [Chloroflexota bacterium]
MISNDFRVSVIIPAYNEAPRIARAVQSVLNQTYAVDEIIVVDDGSTDDTPTVASQFTDKVCYIRQDNQGCAAARNTGISHVKSEWVAFLDADDEWFPSHIENAKTILAAHPEIMWFCAAFERRKEGSLSASVQRVDDTLRTASIISNYFTAEAETSFSRTSSMLVKKEVFKQAGLFNINIKNHGEDLDMWFRIALRHPHIAYCQEPGCIYWSRAGSLTSGSTSDVSRFLERIRITRSAGLVYAEINRNAGADLLIGQWVRYALKDAIKQKDTQSIRLIEREFSDFLSGRWKMILSICKYRIGMNFAHLAFKARLWIKGSS